MRVLFVSRGKNGKISEIIRNQGESLKLADTEVDFFIIRGKGIWGYLKSMPQIRKVFRNGKYDLVHAHYALSAFTATAAVNSPIVVSLMGSDVILSPINRILIRFLSHRWNTIITKTQQLKGILGIDKIIVVPNGVDLDKFKPMPKAEARELLKLPENKKIILFIGDTGRNEKRFNLAVKAVTNLNSPDIELRNVFNMPNEEIPYFLNAADVLLLTSEYEGSPNIIKEAMACNCPIVSTDVGDVRWVTGDTDGCFITSFNPDNITENLNRAILFGRKTNGRNKIIIKGLDSRSVAAKLNAIYEKAISQK